MSTAGLQFSGWSNPLSRQKPSNQGLAGVRISLRVQGKPAVDARQVLEVQQRQGRISGRDFKHGVKSLRELQGALVQWDAGKFNKAKAELLSHCPPSTSLELDIPVQGLPALQTLDVDQLDLSSTRFQVTDELPVRRLQNRLQAAHISSPMIEDVQDVQLQRQLDGMLLGLANALERSDSQGFNRIKSEFTRVYTTATGETIRPDNPLILRLKSADLLSGKRYVGLDLSSVSLLPPEGKSLLLDETALMHCNLKDAFLYRADLDGVTLLGNQMDGMMMPDAKVDRSLWVLNSLELAVLEGARFQDSDVLLNRMPGISLANARFDACELSLNQMQGAWLEGMSVPQTTSSFNVIPANHARLNNNTQLNDRQGARAVLESTKERLIRAGQMLEGHLGDVPPGMARTGLSLEEAAFRKANASELVLPEFLKEFKTIRTMADWLIPSEELPGMLRKRQRYGELGVILPVWVERLNRIPGFEASQTPLADPAFLKDFQERLLNSPPPPAGQTASGQQPSSGGLFGRLKKFLG